MNLNSDSSSRNERLDIRDRVSSYCTNNSSTHNRPLSQISQRKYDIIQPKIQNYFEDGKSTNKRNTNGNQRNKSNSQQRIKQNNLSRKRATFHNKLPRQSSKYKLLQLSDYRQIYNKSGDLGLKTLRLLTLNYLNTEKSPHEPIQETCTSTINEMSEYTKKRRRLSLDDMKDETMIEQAKSNKVTRRYSLMNGFTFLTVHDRDNVGRLPNSKEKRINLLDQNSYKNYCGLLTDFLNRDDDKRIDGRSTVINELDIISLSPIGSRIQNDLSKNNLEQNLNVLPDQSVKFVNNSPSLSLSEIVLSANNIVYNGLEHTDPTNLMDCTFAASMPPQSDILEFDTTHQVDNPKK